MQVFIVASDPDERDFLSFAVKRAGMSAASSGELGRVLANWEAHPADLILFALSGGEPEDAIEEIRAVTPVALIVIIDQITEQGLCNLLGAGSDLVLARPVSSKLVGAYVGAFGRRVGAIPPFVLPQLDLDLIALDPSTRSVSVDGHEPKRLTQLEFRLLYTLMSNRGHVIPTETIVERVWGYSGEGNRDLVRGLISRLRKKIEPENAPNKFLETISGVGYRFNVNEI
jgi:DNA-binding response OmpR family regulator